MKNHARLAVFLLGLAGLAGACASSSPGAHPAPSGPPARGDDPLLSDEFNDPATLSRWSNLEDLEGSSHSYSVLDIAGTTPGRLTIVPDRSVWYNDSTATFLFKMVSGDFVAQTSVNTRSVSDPTRPPSAQFNSAGFVVRDPASRGGAQNWLMYDVGFQDTQVGTEGKTTVNSQSNYELISGARSGLLAICRIGQTIHMFRKLDGEANWSETEHYERPDLPSALQVGLIANGYSGPDLRAEFDYVRFSVPQSVADCTRELGAP